MATLTITDDRGASKVIDFNTILNRVHISMPSGRQVHEILMEELNDVPPGDERSAMVTEWDAESLESIMFYYTGACHRCDQIVLNDGMSFDEKADEPVCKKCLGYGGQS